MHNPAARVTLTTSTRTLGMDMLFALAHANGATLAITPLAANRYTATLAFASSTTACGVYDGLRTAGVRNAQLSTPAAPAPACTCAAEDFGGAHRNGCAAVAPVATSFDQDWM
jgi:hypothetical protein